MFYSGLDRSGSPGREHGSWLVIAIAHVEEADRSSLDAELAAARARLRTFPDFVFRHSEAAARTRREFFTTLRRSPVTAHVLVLDNAAWFAQHGPSASGFDCISDGIITLLTRCPQNIVDQQMLYIDLPRKEGKLVQRHRTTIRQAMRRG